MHNLILVFHLLSSFPFDAAMLACAENYSGIPNDRSVQCKRALEYKSERPDLYRREKLNRVGVCCIVRG